MSRSQTPSRFNDLRGLLIGIACGLLLAISATVQIAHSHDLIGTSHSDCSLCLIVHAGIAPQAPAVIPAPIERRAHIEVRKTETPRISFVFSYYTRPPPAEAAFV